MSGTRRWRDTNHLDQAVDTAGGPEQFAEETERLRSANTGWRLAELRRHRGVTQRQVATRMGVSVPRISQIEKGEGATRDVLDRYITALGGTLRLVADFGDELLKVS